MQSEPLWLSHISALPAGRKRALGAAGRLLLGIAFLLIGSRIIDTRQPHLYGALNDQIAYLNVARNLLEKGTLHSNTVLPSTLWQKTTNDVLYMPGHPMTVPLSYKLL